MVLFIDKVDKENVRPISLSSCFGKIYKRMINERLNWWAENLELYDKNQNGFRRGRSCLENLVKLSNSIRASRMKNQDTLACFLDVSSAYDNVQYGILINKLKELKCPNKVANAISTWMYYREVAFVVEEDKTFKKTVYKGLPQGAVLSPLLYNIYTRDISSSIPQDVKCVQFANDIAIWCRDSKLHKCIEHMESTMDLINVEINKLGLSLQPNKTNAIDFANYSYSTRQGLSIRCVDKLIPVNKEAKFLRVIFDSKLNFESQCRAVKEKVVRINSLFKFLNKISRGIELNTALLLYKSMIRSIIDYGAVVFVSNGNNKSRDIIEKAQYVGIRTALGYRNSTPTNVMLAEAKIESIKERALFLAKNFVFKTIAQGDKEFMNELRVGANREVLKNSTSPWRKRSILTEAVLYCEKYKDIINSFGKGPIFDMDFWYITLPLNIDLESGKNFDTTSSFNNILLKVKNKFSLQNNNYMCIYTDSSRITENPSTGCAFYIEDLQIGFNFSINKFCNIFTAEASAIAVALKWCILKNIDRDIVIFTDSLSVLLAIKNNRIEANKNLYILEIRERYFELMHKVNRLNKKVIFCWIPAHKGIFGNESADKLAKEATRELKVPFNDFRELSKTESLRNTNIEIRNQFNYKGKFYYENFYDNDTRFP
ncbi:uncharacterized protein [Cardiocondyla obscurior]|uniref:uncharacterized protein n=1 Tax=Cardiocondyla obscurior TaxID=286306 RepID=UPI0039656E43